MNKRIRPFTLVEMLTVIAIISLLAAIVIPTVIIAQNRGRVTQAKSDIASITLAMKQMKNDYGKVFVKDGSNYYIGGVAADTESFSCSSGHTHTVVKFAGDAYNAMIAELSVPKNSQLQSATRSRCINKRSRTYLDPKSTFDPTAEYSAGTNPDSLYRDPWNNPYIIYVADNENELQISGNTKTIPGMFAIYSFGANGTDDKGCNVDSDVCINSADSTNHKLHDDISSWNL